MGSARDTVRDTAQAAAGSMGMGYNKDAASFNPAPSKNLYVGNLFFDVTSDHLRKEMERFGTITSVRIVMDNRGLSKGCVPVVFLTKR